MPNLNNSSGQRCSFKTEPIRVFLRNEIDVERPFLFSLLASQALGMMPYACRVAGGHLCHHVIWEWSQSSRNEVKLETQRVRKGEEPVKGTEKKRRGEVRERGGRDMEEEEQKEMVMYT